MTAPLHTRCPQCQTIFHVTPAQLEARAGLVRCGICASAFQADQNLIETLPNNRNPARASATGLFAAVPAKMMGRDADMYMYSLLRLIP